MMTIERCRNCYQPLGLGVCSAKRIVRFSQWVWWVKVHRFCSERCRDMFLQVQADDRERKTPLPNPDRPP